MFTAENILDRTRRQPFIPFRITTSTNATYDVAHPDMVVALRNRLILPLTTDEGVLWAILVPAAMVRRRQPRRKGEVTMGASAALNSQIASPIAETYFPRPSDNRPAAR